MPENPDKTRCTVQLLSIDPAHYARQITLVEIEKFVAINPSELKSMKWTGQEKEKFAPNIVASTRWFNKINFWVQKEILMCEELQTRTNVLSHFVCIAEQLFTLNNLYSAMAIMSALQTECIYRLKFTWNNLPISHKHVYKKLESFFSQKENCIKLRDYTKNMQLPSIPYLGMYLSDLAYTNIAHPKETGGRQSAAWIRKVDAIIEPILFFQKSVFPFTKNETIYNYLMSQRYLDSLQRFVEADNYKLSLYLEPKVIKNAAQGKNDSQNNATDSPRSSTISSPIRQHTTPSSMTRNSYSSSILTSTKKSDYHPEKATETTPVSGLNYDESDCYPKKESFIHSNDSHAKNGELNGQVPLQNDQKAFQDGNDYIDETLKDGNLKSHADEKKAWVMSTNQATDLKEDQLCRNCKCQLTESNRGSDSILPDKASPQDADELVDFEMTSPTKLFNRNQALFDNLNRGLLLTCIHAHLMIDNNQYSTESYNIRILHEGWVKRRTLPYKHHATSVFIQTKTQPVAPQPAGALSIGDEAKLMMRGTYSGSPNTCSQDDAKSGNPLNRRRSTLSTLFSGRLFSSTSNGTASNKSLRKDEYPSCTESVTSPFSYPDKSFSDDTDDSLDESFAAGLSPIHQIKTTPRRSNFLKTICRSMHSNSFSGQSSSIRPEPLSRVLQWKSAWALLVVMSPGKSNSSSKIASNQTKTHVKKHQRTVSNISNWTEPSFMEDEMFGSDRQHRNSISSNNFPSLLDAQASLVYLVFFPKAKSKVLDLHKCYLQCLSRSLSHPIAKVHHAIHKNGSIDNSSFVISSRLKADQQTPNIVRIRPIVTPTTANGHCDAMQNGSLGDPLLSVPTTCRSPVKKIRNLANSLNCTAKQNADQSAAMTLPQHHRYTMNETSHLLGDLLEKDAQAVLVEQWLSAIKRALLM